MAKNKFNKNIADLIMNKAGELTDIGLTVAEDSLVEMSANIINKSPVGVAESDRYTSSPQGKYKANWQIASTVNNTVINKGLPRRQGKRYAVSEISGKLSKKMDTKLYMFNNSPQAGVIEFGGYPDPVILGTKLKSTGEYEKRSSGGFSKQAPSGHVRINVNKFSRIFAKKFKAFFK